MVNQEKQHLKIAFLTSEDPKDKRSYSCSLYYMGQALEKHCGDVYYFDPIISFEKQYIGRVIQKVSLILFKKKVAYDRLPFVAKKHGKIAAQRLDGRSFDVVVALNPVDVAFLETDIPIVLVQDATFALQCDYYPHYSNLSSSSVHKANKVEEMAYQKAMVLLYSSEWAARSAIEDYAVDQQKVYTIFYGANLDTIPPREMVLAKKKTERCRLLFMGIGWERKGGEIAFETFLKLEEMGIVAELIICGTTPPKGFTHERMTVIPFLDRNDERQSKEIEKLYAMSDFLLLPTRCDCAPNVFREANAFGVPVITTNTGGVPDLVKDGENGFVLPLSARGSEYAKVIARIYQDDQCYTELVRSSRAAYEDRLNWDTWGNATKKVLRKVISPVEVFI